MNTKILSIVLCTAIISFCVPALAADQPINAFLGIRLTNTPEILIKHLKLAPSQGQIVEDIYKNSPADKAGIDKDDILITLNNEAILDTESFIAKLRNFSAGDTINLGVIQNGKENKVSVKLAQIPEKIDPGKWKYPAQESQLQIMTPGRVFRLDPDENNWQEIFGMDRIIPQSYTFFHEENGKNYNISITGDPNSEDSTISITDNKDKKVHSAKIGKIDTLPDEYVKIANKYIETAKMIAGQRRNHFEQDLDFPYFSIPDVNIPEMNQMQDKLQPWIEKFDQSKDEQIEKMNDNIEKLKDQINKMQEKLEELLEKHDDNQPSQDRSPARFSSNDIRI